MNPSPDTDDSDVAEDVAAGRTMQLTAKNDGAAELNGQQKLQSQSNLNYGTAFGLGHADAFNTSAFDEIADYDDL